MNDGVVLVAQVCMFNEVKKGNLDRCLDNLRRYCDHIVIYDDGSTDDSVAVARQYTPHIIEAGKNDQMNELAHKQMLLEKGVELGATHLFWLDCDEVLDRTGTLGGLRNLCRGWPEGVDAYSFRELNLWRSQIWVRTDSLFTAGRFIRLWKVIPDIKIEVRHGVHLRLYPAHISPDTTREAPFGVIHYGFCDYKKMMVKIGAHGFDKVALESNARTNWILNESACACYRLPDNEFPPGCLPPDVWSQPKPQPISALPTYDQVPGEQEYPLVDPRALAEWQKLHAADYHGNYDQIKARNRGVWQLQQKDLVNRIKLFKFNPADKVVYDVGCGGGWHLLDSIINGAQVGYGFEIDEGLLNMARTSYEEIGVPLNKYAFINMAQPLPNLPPADIIYCMAVFMHIPYWQAMRYLRWMHDNLKPDGEVHLQFYETDHNTMFWNGLDTVSTIRMETELQRIGFKIKSKTLAEGENILPVWQLYVCDKDF